MDREYERKLDFHAPLLSTRRPGRIIVPREKWELDSSSGFNDRVPFSWEQSPGKPKEILIRARKKYEENKSNLANIMPLKPPPIRLHHPHLQHSNQEDEHEEEDDGCEGDVDENDDDVDFCSGGLDLFSLGESSENFMASKNERKMNRKGGGRRRAVPAPSFIMERFLPAAVALAAASLEALSTESEEEAAIGEACTPGGGRVLPPSVSSPLAFKSCGLENLLPWWTRPKKSSVKGPMRFGCSDWKPQLSPQPK